MNVSALEGIDTLSTPRGLNKNMNVLALEGTVNLSTTRALNKNDTRGAQFFLRITRGVPIRNIPSSAKNF